VLIPLFVVLFQIAICDDYSLPVDFVKKRPSSFDPCLAEAIPANPEHWIAPSPQTEFVSPWSLSGWMGILWGWVVLGGLGGCDGAINCSGQLIDKLHAPSI